MWLFILKFIWAQPSESAKHKFSKPSYQDDYVEEQDSNEDPGDIA